MDKNYNPASGEAEEFINHQEILDTLEYASGHRNDRALVEALLEKAAKCSGLTHREAAVLLECDDPELTERIFQLAKEIKQRFYGNRIVMFAPLYLSNYCVNGCVYCPYHMKNKHIPRKKLTQDEVRATMPQMELKSDVELADALRAMGITDVFEGNADLSGISAEQELCVGRVLHSAALRVDEKGTKAAAATAVEIETMSLREGYNVMLDRPFLLLIWDNQAGMPIFLAAVNAL